MRAQYRAYWYAEPTLGIPIFYGDIKQNNILPGNGEWTLGYGVKVGRQFTYVVGMNFDLIYGKLLGQNERFEKKFSADYYETVVNFTFNLSNLFTWDKRSDKKFNFNAIVGIGYTFHNSVLMDYSTGDTLRKVGFGNGAGFGGRTLEGVYIFGIGLTYNINKNLAVNFETANRMMASDALDGAESGFHNDGYNYTAISFVWKFGLKEDFNKKNKPSSKHVKVKGQKNIKEPKAKKQKSKIKQKYKGYSFGKGEDWINRKKNKKDKYSKFRNKWK